MSGLNLELRRFKMGGQTTSGQLYVNGSYFCDTIEDRNRPGMPSTKQQSKTCIPAGTYRLNIRGSGVQRWETTAKYFPGKPWDQLLLDVENVPGFAGIRIHAGVDHSWTDGCILLNKFTDGPALSDDGPTAYTKMKSPGYTVGHAYVNDLMSIAYPIWKQKQPMSITIIDLVPPLDPSVPWSDTAEYNFIPPEATKDLYPLSGQSNSWDGTLFADNASGPNSTTSMGKESTDLSLIGTTAPKAMTSNQLISFFQDAPNPVLPPLIYEDCEIKPGIELDTMIV